MSFCIQNCGTYGLNPPNELKILKSVRVNPSMAGTYAVNVLKVVKSCIVTWQDAMITSVDYNGGSIRNLTDMYGSIYDGTTSKNLTKSPGAILTGAKPETVFTKDKDFSEIYTVSNSEECQFQEAPSNKSGKNFTVTSKYNTNTYLRLHFTTTDNDMDFTVLVEFRYIPIDGGYLEFV